MKKLVSLVICITMVLSLAACGSKESGTPEPETEEAQTVQAEDGQPEESEAAGAESKIDFEEEPYTIHVCYAVGGEAQPDLPLIQEKLNEITLKEINATVELEAVSLFSAANTYALKASSQEKMDLMIMFPGYSYMTSYANSNLIMPVEEYVDEWGDEIKEVLGDKMKAGEYKGHQYAIPQTKDIRSNAHGFYLNRELCEKYEVDTDAIQTIEDLEAVFAMIQENEPEVIVLMPETAGSSLMNMMVDYYDGCGNGDGILKVEADGSLKIVNQLEEDEYMEGLKKVREWYEAGYISRDVLTSQDGGADLLRVGKCFAIGAASVNPAMGDGDMVAVLVKEKPIVATTDDQLFLWGVASSCERPDKAIQFLNLCDGSAEISNLMMFGIEGTHYTLLDNGAIDISNNANWQNYWVEFGDYNKMYIRDDLLQTMPGAETIEEFADRMREWDVEVSPAYGFNFDPANVKTEIANCDAVHEEYRNVLGNGTVDPEEELPKYIQKLYDAGLQTVIDEKQAQLDEWVASQD